MVGTTTEVGQQKGHSMIGLIAPQIVGTEQRGTTDYSVLKTYLPHRNMAGAVCTDLHRVKYADGTVECKTCGRTGGWGTK